MIGFIPELYPDELVYSVFARYYVYSGYSAYVDAAADLFSNKRTRPVPEFINAMNIGTKEILLRNISMEKLIEKHTMFPAYSRFIPLERRRNAFKALVQTEGNYMNLLYIPTGKQNMKYLRWCPECVNQDRDKYGETYWHRLHQIAGMDICPVHHCRLQQSSVYTGKDTPALISAEQEILEHNNTSEDVSEVEIRLSDYMAEVFMRPVDLMNEINCGLFLNTQIDEKKYYHSNSVMRKLELFYEDYKTYYSEYTGELMSIDTMRKILNGGVASMSYICQIALFEEVSVNDLLSANNIEDFRYRIFCNIAKKLGEPEELVVRIGTAVLDEYASSYRIERQSGVAKAKWDKVDEELFPDVKKAVEEIYGNNNERPHKVTIKAVCRKLALPDKRFDVLPKCKSEILKWSESQEHYWAREVLWAVEQIENRKQELCWRRIRELTNMRKDNFFSCMEEIKKLTDDTTYEHIRQLEMRLL